MTGCISVEFYICSENMYCVTQAERALVCARQTVGQHFEVREGKCK